MAFVDETAITEFWNQAKAYFSYKPGDTITLSKFTMVGYTGSGATSIYFTYPLAKPVTATSATASGFRLILRTPTGGFSHGSTASTSVAASSTAVEIQGDCLRITCNMSDTSGAVANAPIGIYANGTITFS